MQHTEWQELIPFYVAQTLAADEIRRFEAHLANCDACQNEISEWRIIASAVWREADEVARTLPPLSQEVYNRLNYRDRAPGSRYSANPPLAQKNTPANVQQIPQAKRSSIPLTLVAGIVVAVMFGGLLMLLALRNTQDNPSEVALDATLNANMTEQFAMGIGGGADVTATFEAPTTPDLGIIPTLDPELQATNTLPTGPPIFITSTPRASALAATRTPVPPSTTALPPSPLPTQSDTSDIAALQIQDTELPAPTLTPNAPLGGGPYITVTPGTFANGLPVCEAFNPTEIPIEIYAQADRNSELVAILFPEQVVPVTMTSSTGWYLLTLSDGVQGWLQSGFAYLRGNCIASLPLATVQPSPTRMVPTPTAIEMEFPNGEFIVVINASFADLYQGPSFNAAVLGVAERNQQFPVAGYQGTGNNRWVLVTLTNGTQAWIWASIVVEYPANEAPPTATPQ